MDEKQPEKTDRFGRGMIGKTRRAEQSRSDESNGQKKDRNFESRELLPDRPCETQGVRFLQCPKDIGSASP